MTRDLYARGFFDSCRPASEQPAQDRQIAPVAGHLVLGVGLDDHGDVAEARVGEEAGEGGEADLALADVGVAVAARGEGAERVVEMDAADGLPADALAELGQELLVARRLVDRVAR